VTRRTQGERVYTALHNGGVCAAEVLGWSPPITRLAARIWELKQKGIAIESQQPCPEHGGADHAYYRLPLDRLF
jgi:hypothetical protein